MLKIRDFLSLTWKIYISAAKQAIFFAENKRFFVKYKRLFVFHVQLFLIAESGIIQLLHPIRRLYIS